MSNPDEVARNRVKYGSENMLRAPSIQELQDYEPGVPWIGTCMDDTDGEGGMYGRIGPLFGFAPPSGEFELGAQQASGCKACPWRDYRTYGVNPSKCPNFAVTGGREPTIRRKIIGGYTGNITNCCISSAKLDGNKTCDPKYRSGPSAPACSDTYRSICSQNPLDPRCIAWKDATTENKAMYRQLLTAYCGSNMGNKECQEAILREDLSMDNKYDLYCGDHPTVPFCACRVPSNLGTAKTLEDWMAQSPACFSGKCIEGGYKTAGQRANKCPSSVSSCVNNLNVAGDNVKLNNVTTQCLQNATGYPSKTPEVPPPTNYTVYIMVFVFIVVIMLATTPILPYISGLISSDKI